MPTHRVSRDCELHYLVDDYTDPWRAPETILMLHGNAESGVAWFGWVPHLARRFRVVRPDMRGFGASTPMPRDFPWSLDRICDDYVNLVDSIGVARGDVIGIAGQHQQLRARDHPLPRAHLLDRPQPALLGGDDERRATDARQRIRDIGVCDCRHESDLRGY